MTTHFLYFLFNLFSGVLEDAFTILNQSTDVEQLVNISYILVQVYYTFTVLLHCNMCTIILFLEKYDVLLQECPVSLVQMLRCSFACVWFLALLVHSSAVSK